MRFPGSLRLRGHHRPRAVLAGLLIAVALLASVEPSSGQTTPSTPPAAPLGLTRTAAIRSVTLSWADPGDASITGYQVLRRNPAVDAAGMFQIVLADRGSTATSYVDTAVQPSARYAHRVKARNAAGLGPRSSFARVDTPYWDTDATRAEAIDLGGHHAA